MNAAGSFIVTARRVRQGTFIAEPGKSRFLLVPDDGTATPACATSRRAWTKAVLAAGHTHQDERTGEDCGDIVVIVHGYNTTPAGTLDLHRRLCRSLAGEGYRGAVVSFDWPSDDRALNYLEDRTDAKLTALRLVDDCIRLLVTARYAGCRINVHVVAHSMGAYVVREAFDDADDRPALAAANWNVSQLCFVGADVSQVSMSATDARSRSLYRHCNRLTNYSNEHDRVLKLSNVKRIGVAPRAGRRGLPADRPATAAGIDCSDHFAAQYAGTGDSGHSWYFNDPVFVADLAATLAGDDAERATARRRLAADGRLLLA